MNTIRMTLFILMSDYGILASGLLVLFFSHDFSNGSLVIVLYLIVEHWEGDLDSLCVAGYSTLFDCLGDQKMKLAGGRCRA